MLIKSFKFNSQYFPVVTFISDSDPDAEKTMKIGRNAAKQIAEKFEEVKEFIYTLFGFSLMDRVMQSRLMMTGIKFKYDKAGDIESVQFEGMIGVPDRSYRVKFTTDPIVLKWEAPQFRDNVLEIHNAIEVWAITWDKMTQNLPSLFDEVVNANK